MSNFLATGLPVKKTILKQIFDGLLGGETITTLWLPGSGRKHFGPQLGKKDSLSELYSDNQLKNIIFLPLTVYTKWEQVEKDLNDMLSIYSDKTSIRGRFIEITDSGKEIVLVVNNLNEESYETLQRLVNLRNLDPQKIRMLILIHEATFHDIDNKEYLFFLFHNLIQVPYLTKKEAKEWVTTLEKVTDKEFEEMYKWCGGVPLLLKNLLRGMKRTGSVEKAVQSTEFSRIVANYWERFSLREQRVLKTLQITGKKPTDTLEFDYLKTHKLISEQGKIHDWIHLIIKSEGIRHITVKKGHFIWEGISFEHQLSDHEKRILNIMFAKFPNCISRDDVAEAIWEENAEKKYSDWAIDKAMSRLRDKLDEIGLGREIIETKKRKGFYLQNVEID